MVTTGAADVLRLEDAGRLRVGTSADLTVIPALADSAAGSLLKCTRSDVSLVVLRGTPVVGHPALSDVFAARGVDARPVEVDGQIRVMQSRLARALERCAIAEPGVRWLDQ